MKLQLEKFIGKPIKELDKLGDIEKPFQDFDFSPVLNNYRIFVLKAVEELGEMSYDRLQITVDDNQIINEINTGFPVIVDRLFYNEMIKFYGYVLY